MKFTFSKTLEKGWRGIKLWIYNSKDDFPNASAAYIEVVKSHGKCKTTLSDRIYYVVNGNGEFEVNGKKFTVKKGDVVIVPRNSPYDYWTSKGKLKLFLVHVPAYDSKYEIKLGEVEKKK